MLACPAYPHDTSSRSCAHLCIQESLCRSSSSCGKPGQSNDTCKPFASLICSGIYMSSCPLDHDGIAEHLCIHLRHAGLAAQTSTTFSVRKRYQAGPDLSKHPCATFGIHPAATPHWDP
eukprot:scaffold109554_cov24-Tisochrysis_lutea.AAC.1